MSLAVSASSTLTRRHGYSFAPIPVSIPTHHPRTLDKSKSICYLTTMNHLLIDNEFLTELKNQIKIAQKRIYAIIFLTYIHKNRKVDDSRDIRDMLVEAKKRGIDVRIIINRMLKRGLFKNQNSEFAKNLYSNGIVTVVTDTRRTTHAKVWLFDNDRVIIGSHNLTGSSLHSNREMSILVEDPSINNILAEYIEKQIFETITR